MAYLDGQILNELRKLNQAILGSDSKSDFGEMLRELKLLRLAVSESLDVDLEQINIDVADAKSAV